MDKPLFDLVQSLGGQWLSVVFIAGWFLYKSQLVQRLFGAQNAERVRLSTDQQLLVSNLQFAIDRLDQRLTEERAECRQLLTAAHNEREARLAELREECDRELKHLRDEIQTLIRGEARWRHLTGNLAQYVAALQTVLRKAAIEVPRFTGWETFIADGGDPLLSLE